MYVQEHCISTLQTISSAVLASDYDEMKKINYPSIAFIIVLDLLVTLHNEWLQGNVLFNYSDKWINTDHHQMVLYFLGIFSEYTDYIAYEQKKTTSLIVKQIC